jgi:hypothetical protein
MTGWVVGAVVAGVAVGQGHTAVGRGPSVSGWVAERSGTPPRGPCTVEVRGPAGRRESSTRSAPVSATGFFKVLGVDPGPSLVSALCPGARATRPVTVRLHAATLLPDPLVLDGVALDVVVTPALDPSGRPWRLDVFDTTSDRRQIAAGEPLSPDGRWVRPASRGFYQLDLRTAAGARWLSRPVELTERTGPLGLDARGLKVTGVVYAARGPLRAGLVFSNDATHAEVALQSGEDGSFRGHLPWSDEVQGSGWDVEVSSTTPPVSHRLQQVAIPAAEGDAEAWLDLTVPAAAARGTVLSEDGQPQQNAQVLSESLDDAAAVHVATTDEKGNFELRGLPAGPYRVTAEGTHGLSEPYELRLGDDVEAEIVLVLKRRKRLVQGEVRSGEGPVAGAAANVWHPPGMARGSTLTDEQGRFELGLPRDVNEVGLTVGAPGFALRMMRVPAAGPITIPLDTPSGTLVLVGAAQDDGPGTPATVLVAHNGAVESLDALLDWGVRNGGGVEGETVVVPGVEPGVYSVCRVLPREVATLWSGSNGTGACQGGTLAAGGRLQLSLPNPPTRVSAR